MYKHNKQQRVTRKETQMRNHFAAALSSKIFQKKIVTPKKGKGSYTRKGR